MPKVSSDNVIRTPQRAKPYTTTKPSVVTPKVTHRVNKIHTCLVCNGNVKEGKKLNLQDGINELMYHYAGCLYDKHHYKNIIDPGPDNRDEAGDPLEIFGSRFKYKCPFPVCEKNGGRRPARMMGFKEYCIHLAVVHFILETRFGLQAGTVDNIVYIFGKYCINILYYVLMSYYFFFRRPRRGTNR